MELLQNLENFCSSNVYGIMALSNQGYLDHHPQRPHIPVAFTDNNIHSSFQSDNGLIYDPLLSHHLMPPAPGPCRAMSEAESLVKSSFPPPPPAFAGDHNNTFRNYNCGGRKRKRNKQSEPEKLREVVHVRARRGQATDSHSLAERMRREKINEKLRCLQELVPGCYKTMGMAVMLDVIINYVRSLQNQIEFLSMKLSAASLFYDFNSSEMEAMEMMKGTDGYEERTVGVGYGGFSHFPSAWPL